MTGLFLFNMCFYKVFTCGLLLVLLSGWVSDLDIYSSTWLLLGKRESRVLICFKLDLALSLFITTSSNVIRLLWKYVKCMFYFDIHRAPSKLLCTTLPPET
jgi:hypothetical protein